VASVQYAPIVASVIKQFGFTELLDYGAGKGRLGETLKSMGLNPEITHYDPAIKQWSAHPSPKECVACIDVLEHIEPDLLDNVLDDLKSLTSKVGVFTVHTGPAIKTLPDGRNAHLIQQKSNWWIPKIISRFELLVFQSTGNGFFVVVKSC
jgi:hypothetical protein